MERSDLGRIVAFSDGVMAVAITLLVLNLEVPVLPSGREEELGDKLVDLLPSLLAYALAFGLVGRYWVVHHRFFERLWAFDGRLMAQNLVFLALIALMPFTTELVDRYNDEPIAVAVFGATLGIAALVNLAMARHALRADLFHEHARRTDEPFVGAVSLSLATLFLLSVPVAFLSTLVSHLMWLAGFVARYPLRRLGR
jgi:uncharacterized membrane protein